MNYRVEEVFAVLELALDTKAKKHVAGGVLMSVALLFGGLAVTVMTLKQEDKNDGRKR